MRRSEQVHRQHIRRTSSTRQRGGQEPSCPDRETRIRTMKRMLMAASALALLTAANVSDANAGNRSVVEQYGSCNGAVASQLGKRNTSTSYQRGRCNLVRTFQKGRRNLAVTGQQGVRNFAETVQEGRRNVSGIA